MTAEAAKAPSDRTLEPDRDARKALAQTLVLRGPSASSAAPTRSEPGDDIPTISMGHNSLEDPPAELEVLSALGVGGTGRVYLAHQRSLHRDVAVKVLKDDAADLGVCLVYEARVATRIDHPNVVPVYLLGRTSNGMPVLVMKRIRGVSWLELVEQPDNPLWDELAGKRERLLAHLEIFLAVCNAVGAAHRQGIIHRDIKPSNVMVAGAGEVYLTDWGIAFDRSTPPPPTPGSLVGTPAYMAPEMLSGVPRDIDERTDIFMLGATLHFTLTGTYRNLGSTNEQALASLRALAPFRYGIGIPEELGAICNRATAAEPSERFHTVAELREAVQTFLYHHESYRIAERARTLLESALALTPEDVGMPRRIEEVRMVLLAALEAWRDNTLAAMLFDRLRVLEVEVALANDNVVMARRRLGEMTTAPPELVARVAAIEADEQLKRERAARHAAFERELDLRTAARTRRWFFRLFGLYAIGAVTMFVALRTRLGEDQSGVRALLFAAVSSLFLSTMAIIARREIMRNRINRAIVGLVLAYIGFNLIHRIVAIALDGSPRLTLTVDIISAGFLSALGSVLITSRLWPVPVVCGLAVTVSLFVPPASQAMYAVASLFMVWRMLREWGHDPTR